MSGIVWVELCAGAAATTLRLLGGAHLQPVVSWMGGKRWYAGDILAAVDLEPHQRVERVLLADAGPWGWVWPVLLEQGVEVGEVLEAWADKDPRELWAELAAAPPADELAERVAGWLVLQQGNFNGKPVTARDGRWRTDGFARPSEESWTRNGSCVSIRRPLEALQALRSSSPPPIEVIHGDVLELEPIPGAVVYLDPPYVGKTGYGWDLDRAAVLEVAQRWSAAGCTVAVSEAEPLPLEGWFHVDLSPVGRKGSGPEWLTMNRPPARTPDVQIALFG